MAKVGAQRASELTGRSKSTIQRAMNAGKLSFEVDNGRRLIDVSELDRVFGLLPQGQEGPMSMSSMGSSMSEGSYSSSMAAEMELERTKSALEQERLSMKVRMLEDQLEDARRQIEDMRAQRDLWQKQAQQVLLTSQYSQKQSEERIAEMQAREEARQKAIAEAKARHQAQMQQRGGSASSSSSSSSMVKKIAPINQNVRESSAEAAHAENPASFFLSLFGGARKKA